MVGINTNVSALNARASLDANSVNQANAMQQLSTGLRINSAKDDAAGLAIATKMNSNIRGVAVAVRNANDGISMAQTAESALGSVTNMLQRMRELAVQASNGTLTGQNRASMQLEVKQLASEIDNIGKTANFNGIKLFDGSASNISLQTNVNAGDMVKMGIGSMSTNTIGLGSRSSLTSWGFDADQASAGNIASKLAGAIATNGIGKGLSAGDLTINGVTIGSSVAADDSASIGSKESSAISKVAAINRSSSMTGVTATVNQTVASGKSMVVGSANQSGQLMINGVSTSSITLTGNTSQDRALAVKAINEISGSTGVTAVDTGSDKNGVQLIAADGRNIFAASYATTTSSTFSAANVGVNAASAGSVTLASSVTSFNAFTGSFTLQSTTSSPITIGTTVAATSTTSNLTNAGLMVGTYAANTSYAIGTGRASGTSAGDAVALGSGDLVINGVTVGASLGTDDHSSNGAALGGSKDSSAIAIAAAINKVSGQTGVSATAQANIIAGTGYSAVTSSTTSALFINGVSVSMTLDETSKAIDVVNQINNYSSATGVVASDNGKGVTLTASDGRNIEIGTRSSGVFNSANLGLELSSLDKSNGRSVLAEGIGSAAGGATVYYAGVTLVSDKSFTVEAGSSESAASNISKLGFTEGTFGGSNNGTKISSVDISSVAGAQDALGAIDAALGQISDQRSNLGAIQNRLQSAVDNLTSSSTNLQAAAGRIQDTDYSTTTTQMSKSQIIAQAATAMLAQANQQPQMVLSLLK